MIHLETGLSAHLPTLYFRHKVSFPQLAMPVAFIFSVGGDMVSFFQEVVDPSVHLDQS